jgi:hypothetical protein
MSPLPLRAAILPHRGAVLNAITLLLARPYVGRVLGAIVLFLFAVTSTLSSADAAEGEPLPFQVHSREDGNLLTAEISGVVQHPFAVVTQALLHPGNWCEFVPLNLNVKACTSSSRQDLSIFVGRKKHQTPEQAYQLEYRFTVIEQTDSFFSVHLTAKNGPLGTKDHRIELTGTRSGTGTFLKFRSSYRESLRSKLATEGYLRTLGRDKVGFSVTGRTPTGESVLVGGVIGVLERNAMRYYLALQAFFDTRLLPEEERFEGRIRHWFELTSRFPRQLWEMDKEEYLATKRRERQQQLRLQG